MISRVAWSFACFALVACGGSGSPTGGGDGMDGGGSSGSGGSSNGGGNGSGSGGSSGSVSSSSGGSGGSTSSGGSGGGSGSGGSSGSGSTSSSGSSSGGSSSGCMTPSDCASGEACCATIPIIGGSIPNCTSGTLTAVCKAKSACPTHLAIMCSGTEQVQICNGPSDCANAGAGNTMCCTFTNDAGSLSFCASGLIGGVGGGSCK